MHQKIIQRLHALNPDTVKLGLKNITKLLKSLGDPHTKFHAIHIAGTNGKGSTAYFLNSIFKTAGYKTGLYLSPHLTDVRERVIIGFDPIPEKKLSELTEKIFYVMQKEKLSVTFFEFITALAFLYFCQEKIDLGIIEVGLGGRLDATNVLTPLLSVITEIGLEHTAYLGSTIKKIALEKAGIIKPGGAVFISTENNEAISVFDDITKKKSVTSFRYGKDFLAINPGNFSTTQTFSFKYRDRTIKPLQIETAGAYQIKNSSTAVAVALYLNKQYPAINEGVIRKGLKDTKLPCRMEVAGKAPLIVLDVAHNHQAIELLTKNIPRYFSYKRLIVLLGILKDKDYKKIIHTVSSEADILIVTEPNTERALSARLLQKEASALHSKIFMEEEISKALNKAKELAKPQDLILITGSFYTAGEALSVL